MMLGEGGFDYLLGNLGQFQPVIHTTSLGVVCRFHISQHNVQRQSLTTRPTQYRHQNKPAHLLAKCICSLVLYRLTK